MIRPMIDVYFDPNGWMSGKAGCYRARLTDSHGCHGAGRTPQEAVESVVRTAVSFYDYAENGVCRYAHLPKSADEYEKLRLEPYYFKPMEGPWDQIDETDNRNRVDEAREVAAIVAHILTPQRF